MTTRTWLITGDSHGLGRALAAAVLESADRLVLAADTAELAADLRDLADRHGDRLRVVVPDPTDGASSAAAAAVRTALDTFGRLDVVVNLAGSAGNGAGAELSEQSLRAQLETSLFGAVHLAQAVLPVFRSQRSGHFVQFGPAGGGLASASGSAPGRAAALALEGFAEGLHEEAARFGARVTVVDPGVLGSDDVTHPVRRFAGDLTRAARVLVDLVGAEHPPLRLVLGAEAAQRAEQSARARLQEVVVWSDVSRSADGPGARHRGLAPVLHLMESAAG